MGINYSYARGLLEGVVQWLEHVDEKTNDDAWEDKAFDIAECISELNVKDKSKKRLDKNRSSQQHISHYHGHGPGYAIAIPILKEMLIWITKRNRDAALESGKAAIPKLPLLSR